MMLQSDECKMSRTLGSLACSERHAKAGFAVGACAGLFTPCKLVMRAGGMKPLREQLSRYLPPYLFDRLNLESIRLIARDVGNMGI